MSAHEVVSLAAHRELQRLGTMLMPSNRPGLTIAQAKAQLEPVSLGALRIELWHTKAHPWLLMDELYTFRATELVDSFVSIDLELHDINEVKKMLEFCRKSARARHLTLNVRNHTDQPYWLLGISAEELDTATI